MGTDSSWSPDDLGRVLGIGGKPVGTCFQVRPGLLVTAWHVVSAAGGRSVGAEVLVAPLDGAGSPASAVVRNVDELRDLAVLTCSVPLRASVPGLVNSASAPAGTEVSVTGVSDFENQIRYEYTSTVGTMQGAAHRADGVLHAQMTAAGLVKGMSGGPVRRISDGWVVGVVVARYSAADFWLAGTVWVARIEDLAPLLPADVGISDGRPDSAPANLTLTGDAVAVSRSAQGAADEDTRGEFATSVPRFWNVARANPNFTGRQRMLKNLHKTLRGGQRAAVQALHGMGGVGKSQLAIEYAHRFAKEYEIVWWINSERPELIGDQLAALAVEVGLATESAETPSAFAKLKAYLRSVGRWLLIYDNAEACDTLLPWLPDGNGHIIITSRSPIWTGVALPLNISVFSRAESIAFLRTRLPQLERQILDRLADAVGDLPLAAAQAADLLSATGMPVEAYLAELRRHAAEVLAAGPGPADYPMPLAAAIKLAAARLDAENPACLQLLTLCAYLAPDPIPAGLFYYEADEVALPVELATVAGSPIALSQIFGQITRYGLARLTANGIQLHRLTQAILRDIDSDSESHRKAVEGLISAAVPGNTAVPSAWPRWNLLLPHILACHPAESDNVEIRAAAIHAAWFLLKRGDPAAALPLAEQLHRASVARSGADDLETLEAASTLATIHRLVDNHAAARLMDADVLRRYRRILGRDHLKTIIAAQSYADDLRQIDKYGLARLLDEDTLARCRQVLGDEHPKTLITTHNLARNFRLLELHAKARELELLAIDGFRRVLGDDHPDTLRSAIALAGDLRRAGEHAEARQLAEETVRRAHAALGEGHPDELSHARNLARYLREVGEFEEARQLDQETLERSRRTRGNDHADTLTVAHHLGVDLRELGEFEQARRLDQETLERSRRTRGNDHADTLAVALNLAIDLRQLGEFEEARQLDQDTLERSRRTRGNDHHDTLAAAHNLAIDLRQLGEFEQARQLHQETLERFRRTQGNDHADTLTTAQNLAVDLRKLARFEEAARLGQDTLERCRRVYGDDRDSTLSVAQNLASDLRQLHRFEEARRLDEGTLERRRRTRGDDHGSTLSVAFNLAIDLRELANFEEAARLGQDTLERSRRIRGDDHDRTLAIAENLAGDLRQLDRVEEARRLDEDTLGRRRRAGGEGQTNA
ncbi:FxSxx-COOH system tetratricopeptide repeat protein [Dactylosporangium sp. NPDC051541]|uniref:FxSxx-COOH system tetratricopeptide repeat protein n=1 Tax=Dactylosporangium sp. NPDC051541 TaxID=3363977 RepID=UPI00379024D3